MLFFHFADILTASSVFPVFTPSKEKGPAASTLDKAEFYFQTLYEFVSFVKFVVKKSFEQFGISLTYSYLSIKYSRSEMLK
jgi:hypothetical protein